MIPILKHLQEQLKHVDDPVLRQLRDLCQDNAQHLEQLVISDLEAREGNDAEKLEEAKRRSFDHVGDADSRWIRWCMYINLFIDTCTYVYTYFCLYLSRYKTD